MNRRFSVCLVATAFCAGMVRVAPAQVAPKPETRLFPVSQAKERSKVQRVQIENVPPSLIAWWIDPKNNPEPVRFQSRKRESTSRISAGHNPGAFVLPAGIDRIVAIDPQKSLLIFGSDAAIKELRETIELLDQPLRQVEIETQWVQISPEDAKAFGINYNLNQGNFGDDFPPIADKNTPQIGFVRGNFQATLTQLVTASKAKIITALRVIAINNVQADLRTSNASSVVVKSENAADQVAKMFEGPTQIGFEREISVTPTINNDDTVTILMSTRSILKMTTAKGVELASSGEKDGTESIVNARDGQTVALSGSASRLFPGLKADAQNPAANVIVFVTPRIARRAADDVKAVALGR